MTRQEELDYIKEIRKLRRRIQELENENKELEYLVKITIKRAIENDR